MGVGLGEFDEFDCSGLIIHALSKVLGMPVAAWPRELRHTRQLWNEQRATCLQYAAGVAEPGDLIVFRRRWTMQNGEDRWVPAHIGIATETAQGSLPVLLQAQAKVGAVIEGPIRKTEDILGTLSPSELASRMGQLTLSVV